MSLETDQDSVEIEIEVAVFPIPGSVNFPYSRVPLHVFEPRYRKMVHDSIEQRRRIGVAHARKVISPSKVKPDASIEQRLSTNQASYEPHTVFSAGFAELIETLPDGRMLIEIHMDSRYELVEVLQQVPYRVAKCRPYHDRHERASAVGAGLAQANIIELRRSLDEILLEIASQSAPELQELIRNPRWLKQSDDEYSFKIFSVVGFDPKITQAVLEMRSQCERIQFLIDMLTRPPVQH